MDGDIQGNSLSRMIPIGGNCDDIRDTIRSQQPKPIGLVLNRISYVLNGIVTRLTAGKGMAPLCIALIHLGTFLKVANLHSFIPVLQPD